MLQPRVQTVDELRRDARVRRAAVRTAQFRIVNTTRLCINHMRKHSLSTARQITAAGQNVGGAINLGIVWGMNIRALPYGNFL